MRFILLLGVLALLVGLAWDSGLTTKDNLMNLGLRLAGIPETLNMETMWYLEYPRHAKNIANQRDVNDMAVNVLEAIGVSSEAQSLSHLVREVSIPGGPTVFVVRPPTLPPKVP
eukprot:Hpha_TRINITY_DN7242_c0_g1::TRINITY_DN7242_c0_g1_i1::g.102212::m.102212